jgi:probable phosphoglycerate mutase
VELLLVRHALPVRRAVLEGPADPELSADGVEQARHLGDYLAVEDVEAVYSSPLRRAAQTAAPVAAAHALTVHLVDDLAEWDRSATEYVPVEELKAANDPRWQALVSGEWQSHDESPDDFRRRVVDAVEAIIGRHPGGRAVAVCHGGVINAYLAEILGIGTKPGFFYPNYTSIHRVAADRRGNRSVVTVNETAHLRGTGLPVGLLQG